MRTIKDYSKKDLAAVLYMHYLDNYCEDDFSFDKGKMRRKVEAHFNSLNLSDEEFADIEENIRCKEAEGTDYNSLEFTIKGVSNFFLQVTSMFDYDGKCCTTKYKGSAEYCDTGLFFINYQSVDIFDERCHIW